MSNKAPKAKLKSIFKENNKKFRLQKNTELLVFMDYVLFLKQLVTEAELKAQEEKESIIQPCHVKACAKKVLKQCRG